MSRFTTPLTIGEGYERKTLAELWGLASFHPLGRGVFTPAGEREIFLFVTREKEGWMTQYRDFLQGDLLFWEGENRHGSDERIIRAAREGHTLHLFYRDRRHTPFAYHGEIMLAQALRQTDRPSQFVFSVPALAAIPREPAEAVVAEDPADYALLSAAGLASIDAEVAARSRGIAQRVFRGNVLRLWQGACAVTGVQEARVLRAGHIKPWRMSTVEEKVNHFNGLLLVPNLDALFNEGLVSFRDSGQILVSDAWSPDDKRRLHITPDLHLRTVHPESTPYLEYHRDTIFEQGA